MKKTQKLQHKISKQQALKSLVIRENVGGPKEDLWVEGVRFHFLLYYQCLHSLSTLQSLHYLHQTNDGGHAPAQQILLSVDVFLLFLPLPLPLEFLPLPLPFAVTDLRATKFIFFFFFTD